MRYGQREEGGEEGKKYGREKRVYVVGRKFDAENKTNKKLRGEGRGGEGRGGEGIDCVGRRVQ